jgi:hypothetical protein
MTDAEIDNLTKKVDALCAEIDTAVAKAARHRVTVEHFDDNGNHGDDDGDYEDVSNPSMSADDDSENYDDNGDDEDDDDDEEDNTLASKRSINEVLRVHDRPGSLKHIDHPAPNRHKFEALVDKIKNDHGIPKSEAMAEVRRQFPDVYAAYQKHTNSDSLTSLARRSTANRTVWR